MTHRHRTPHMQRGFTLVEILVTTAIFAIIMIAALSVYDQSNKVFKTSTEQADLQQSTRIGFDKLVSDLRMAGFDYSRGGIPSGDGQYAQPDEQIEYAGPTVVAFRANFNYTSAAALGNGLEPTYTPKTSKGAAIFPYVTTSNNEIVIYALKSADSSKNTQSISFFADTAIPRIAYPPKGTETKVTVDGIDTTNNNPPYTLYRFTVTTNPGQNATANTGVTAGTPVAENIRALHFFYYTDTRGTAVLKDPADNTKDISVGHNADGTTFSTSYSVTLPDGSTPTYNTGAVGGDGQYDANNPATNNFGDRNMRAQIQSIKVDLTGMNANPDSKYTNPTESIAALKSYRQYQLSALIVPRNLGLTGFPEPSYSKPGPPTITGMCASACAAPVICWTPPTTAGPVLQYRIEWDSAQEGAYANSLVITDPAATSAILPDDGVMNPALTWYYRIIAQNDNGDSEHSVPFPLSPKNMTRPKPPSSVSATTATTPASVTPANVDYAIGLGWASPAQNDPATAGVACSGSGCVADGATIPAQEIIRYKVSRGLTPTFDPDKGEGATVLDVLTKSQPAVVPPGSGVAWSDSPLTSIIPPGTCVPYYYRVQAQDRCASDPSYNASNKTKDSVSDWSPAYPVSGKTGQAYDAGAGVQASAPPTISIDSNKSSCPVNGTCTIYLSWSQVTTDNAGHAIGVDKYRISRFKKTNVGNDDYKADTSFGTNGYVDQSGASQSNSGNVSYVDSTAPAADTNGQPLYYKYIVTANDCRLGLDSGPAYYPSLCTPQIYPDIKASGASNSGTGDSPFQAWVLGYGDTITVSQSSGGPAIKSVKFTVYTYPGLKLADDFALDSAAPFTYTWLAQTDLQIYYVKIVVTSADCSEEHVKYVQDEQAAACAFTNQAAPVPSESVQGSTVTATAILTLKNNGADTMTLNTQTYSFTFLDPDGNHSDIKLTSVVFSSASGTFTDTPTTSLAPASYLRNLPTGSPSLTVLTGANLTVTIRWQYAKKDSAGKDKAAITVSPLTKLCIGYTIPSELNVAKKCNAVGQAANSANPNSCD